MCGLSWSLEMTYMMYFDFKMCTARWVCDNEDSVKVLKLFSEE